MKLTKVWIAAGVLALAPAAFAQKWEIGGGVGAGFYPANTITNGSASASLDTQTSLAGSVWLANNATGHWGGETRLDYSRGDLQLTSGGNEAKFNSEAYGLHYDFQYYPIKSESRVRPYLTAGAGIKYYRGIGNQVEFQPLSQFALLSQTNQLKPMVSVGGGVKLRVTDRLGIRLEVHDYLTTFPDNLVVPNVGSKVSGWMQQIVPMLGVSYLF
jgi:outer membrane protein W